MEYPLGLSDEGFVAKMMQSDILHRGQQIMAHHEIQDLAEPLLSLAGGFTKRKRTPDHAKKELADPTAFVQQVKKRRRINEEDDAAVWEARFSELREFREKYGHCRVPQAWKENKKLGSWVARVRNQKRKNKLKEDRIKALEDLGFVWCCRDVSMKGRNRKTVPWRKRFEELKAFKDKFGHCNVPHKWENQKLTNWVYCQRSFHRHTKLSEEKIKMLESIGFVWTKEPLDPQTPPQSPPSSSEQVVSPANDNDDSSTTPDQDGIDSSFSSNPPSPSNTLPSISPPSVPLPPDPASFVKDIKGKPFLLIAPVPSRPKPSSELQIAEGVEQHDNNTDSSNGSYNEKKAQVKERKSWHERFSELKAFKERYGHCNVPWRWKENLPLFYWVRRMKDKRRNGLLPQECIAQMDALGFEWVKPAKPKVPDADSAPAHHVTHSLPMDLDQSQLDAALAQHDPAALGLHLLRHSSSPLNLSRQDMPALQELQQVLGVQLPQESIGIHHLV